jgi:DeoR/GlpR family transcriptional regulator of sugar metabolism
MSEKLKIFLGADKHGADNLELEQLGKKAMADGFCCYRNFTVAANMIKQELSDNKENTQVIIRGGSIEACVAMTVKNLTELGLNDIQVDLGNCRINGSDSGNNENTIKKRQELLKKRLLFLVKKS